MICSPCLKAHGIITQSIEVTRMMLGGGKHRSIVASTVCEIEGVLPLVEEGILDEVCCPQPDAELHEGQITYRHHNSASTDYP